MSVIGDAEVVEAFAAFGIRAFTTSRYSGSFGLASRESVGEVMARWATLRKELGSGLRLATASQIHGARVVEHQACWEGWLRVDGADGHVAAKRGTVLAVTVADCVPVFISHPSGATALLHSGWRGTAARIVLRGIEALARHGAAPPELHVHLGPAICGRCYEVSPDVYGQLTGRAVEQKTTVDLRALIADHARAAGVREITVSGSCTRCDNARFFSHRAGDEGRQLGVIIATERSA